ncbi:MAG: hypothetical protein LH624_03330 [Cryobacterium sp.]|nr:hypothetical protein [Cryobacterium sp.]
METSSSYRPRDWCVTPRLFGKAERVTWRTPNGPVESAQQGAARLQHTYALKIQLLLRAQGISVRGFCAASGKTYDRMLRVLNGQMVMRLEDVAIADILLGPIAVLATDAERSAARERFGLKALPPQPGRAPGGPGRL